MGKERVPFPIKSRSTDRKIKDMNPIPYGKRQMPEMRTSCHSGQNKVPQTPEGA
jgi:hypothetical protein